MKYISSKLLRKSGGRDQGKYLLTVEVTDRDVNNFEDLAICYVVKGYANRPPAEQHDESHELDKKYKTWVRRIYTDVFHKLWKVHDICGCDRQARSKQVKLTILDSILSKSKLTEKDALEIGASVNKALAKRYKAIKR